MYTLLLFLLFQKIAILNIYISADLLNQLSQSIELKSSWEPYIQSLQKMLRQI